MFDECANGTGITVTLSDAGGDRSALGKKLGTILYRVAQEALTNIKRHAGASQVALDLTTAGESGPARNQGDDRGFDPDRPPSRGS